MQDAPTPRLYGNTPGASGGGGGGDRGPYAAPTPGGMPETPAPFTPAAVAGDDDDDDNPRYE